MNAETILALTQLADTLIASLLKVRQVLNQEGVTVEQRADLNARIAKALAADEAEQAARPTSPQTP